MANTYTQLYAHVVFAVTGRACVIRNEHKEQLQKHHGDSDTTASRTNRHELHA